MTFIDDQVSNVRQDKKNVRFDATCRSIFSDMNDKAKMRDPAYTPACGGLMSVCWPVKGVQRVGKTGFRLVLP